MLFENFHFPVRKKAFLQSIIYENYFFLVLIYDSWIGSSSKTRDAKKENSFFLFFQRFL